MRVLCPSPSILALSFDRRRGVGGRAAKADDHDALAAAAPRAFDAANDATRPAAGAAASSELCPDQPGGAGLTA